MKLVADMNSDSKSIHAEIAISPAGTGSTSMSKEVAAAFDAISNLKNIKNVTLTAMGTQIEANDMTNILKAIEVAHNAVRLTGVKRIITTIRIDERLDTSKTLQDNVESVKEKLPKR